MKKFLGLVFLILILAAGYLAYALFIPVNVDDQRFVLLRPGSSARTIAKQLRHEKVIRSWPAFLLLHYFKVRPLQAGEYVFNRPANAIQVYKRIAAGDIYARSVIIPEGYNMFEVAAAIEAAGLGSSPEFLDVARSQRALVADLDPQAQSLEGYLFPDTYNFTRTQSLSDIAAVMVKRFRQEARSLGLTSDVHRTVTLASIVEKETSVPEERPLLARRYRGTIFQSDLQYKSPYNTYLYRGLPPGPVSNPGRASLQAAMQPANTEFLYFVSDNQGGHRFARTGA